MEVWTQSREFVSRHVAPINTVVFGITGIIIPFFDFVRPRGPYLIFGAVVMGLLFISAVIASRWSRWPRLPTALTAGLGISAALFTVGAAASYQHATGGGAIVSAIPSLQPFQDLLVGLHADVRTANEKLEQQGKVLADIRSGKSDDPRVALRNMGIAWEYNKFLEASKAGDLRVMQLFLEGGMPASQLNGQTLAFNLIYIRAPHSAEQLALLEKFGTDLHGPAAVSGSASDGLPQSLYVVAVDAKNIEAQQYLLKHGSKHEEYAAWTAAHKRVRETGYWM